MFVSQYRFDEFANQVLAQLAHLEIDMPRDSCPDNVCKCCEYGTVVALKTGVAKTVCGKHMKERCPDFKPRPFGEARLYDPKKEK